MQSGCRNPSSHSHHVTKWQKLQLYNQIIVGVVVRRPDSVIYRMVIFSTVVKWLESNKTTDMDLTINNKNLQFINTKV
jgi:hypothetical protein